MMGSQRNYNLDAETLNHYLKIAKTIDKEVVFEYYPRKSKKTPNGFYLWKSTYILSAGDTVDNLYLSLKSMRNIEHEYHSFMLSYRHHNMENIIYQLEWYPEDVISHRDKKNGDTIYGAHIHHINKVQEARPKNYEQFTWYEWLDYFKEQTNIVMSGKIISAFDGELPL